jgi:hypothetical protein
MSRQNLVLGIKEGNNKGTPSLRDPQGLKERQRRGNLLATDPGPGRLLRCARNDGVA